MLIPFDEGRRYAPDAFAGKLTCAALNTVERALLHPLGIDQLNLTIIAEIAHAYEKARVGKSTSFYPDRNPRSFIDLLKMREHRLTDYQKQERAGA